MSGKSDVGSADEAWVAAVLLQCETMAGPTAEPVVDQVLARDFSTILTFSATIAGSRRRFVAKKVRHHPINEKITTSSNQALVEYETLSMLYAALDASAGYGVPAPVFVLPEHEVFVMEHVDGKLVSDLLPHLRLFKPLHRFRELQQAYFCMGKWLSDFQNKTAAGFRGPECLGDIIDKTRVRVGLIARHEEGKHHWILDAVETILDTAQSRHAASNSRVCGRHGDFGHWNAIATLRGVTVFDLMGYDVAPPFVDLLKIMFSMRWFGLDPLNSRRRVKQLKAEFLRGYGAWPKPDPYASSVCEVYYAICDIHAALINPGRHWLDRLRRHRLLKDATGRIMAMLDGQFLFL